MKRARGQIISVDKSGALIRTAIIPEASDKAEVIFYSSGEISAEQRKKCYALIRDISLWSGHYPEEIKEIMKYDFMARSGYKYFSLSSVSCETASAFIGHLIEFCLINDIPCMDSLLEICEDIARYLYLCLVTKKCCICGRKTQLHHTDTVGMGYDRQEIAHLGKKCEALCYKHHRECHNIGQKDFDEKYHIFGICADKVICDKYNLRREKKSRRTNAAVR